MENKQIELKLNLDTARDNPIGFTQWLATELLRRARVSKDDWEASLKAIKYLNRFRAMVEEAKKEEFMEEQRLEFKTYTDNRNLEGGVSNGRA